MCKAPVCRAVESGPCSKSMTSCGSCLDGLVHPSLSVVLFPAAAAPSQVLVGSCWCQKPPNIPHPNQKQKHDRTLIRFIPKSQLESGHPFAHSQLSITNSIKSKLLNPIPTYVSNHISHYSPSHILSSSQIKGFNALLLLLLQLQCPSSQP